MIKKVFLFFVIVFSSISFVEAQSSITLTTTSTDAVWSPRSINTGTSLHWEASGGGIITQTHDGTDLPVFDLTLNTGTVTVIAESTNGFSDFTRFEAYTNNLTSVDVSQSPQLPQLYIQNNQISSIDISSNTGLINFKIDQNNLPSSELDAIVNQLDANGLSDGTLQIANNAGDLTTAAQPAYDNLIGKGWTIDVSAPLGDTDPPVIGVLNTPTNVLQTTLTLDWTAATDNVGVTNYNIFQDNVLIATVGNVLTYNVTGLTLNTNYDFHITALDNEGNESVNSNNQNVTTLVAVSTITLTTTSTDAVWSPRSINTGTSLHWEASGGGIITQTHDGTDLPVFDLTLNTGTVTVIAESTNGFSDFTRFEAYTNNLTSVDVSQSPQLPQLYIQNNQISSIDISSNTGLINFKIDQNNLPSSELDAIVNQLDANGLSDGTLQIANNAGDLTTAAQPAYDNLIGKGWTIDVAAPAPVPGPKINITGNGQSISNANTPIIADDTDFGQVQIGSPITHTFTISNIGDSNLMINFFFTSGTDFTFVPPGGGGITLTPGSSTTIDATFNPQTSGIKTGTITINSTDPDDPSYVVNLTAEGIPASSGTIDVQGGTPPISIANGDTTPDIADDTDFGSVLNNTTKTTTYTIYNNHITENLTVNSIGLGFGVNEFQIGTISESLPFDLAPGGSITFDVAFTPLATGSYQTYVQIDNSETGQNPFQYNIAGQGGDIVVSGDIMITQYYHGIVSDNSKWIEIKNISGAVISAGTYFLALYSDTDIPNIDTQAPTASESIPEMAIDEVLLFKNVATPAVPNAANIGTAIQIQTTVCDFDGDDVILISSTNDLTCYANRQDIVGTVPESEWGKERSYIRGGNFELPEADFMVNHWIFLSVQSEVNVANSNTNIALGTQDVDTAIWNGSWSHSIDPDKTRNVELQTDYTAADGTFEAGNLIVNANLNLNGGTTNSVIVHGDLTINGSFTIGDQESLVMYNGILGNPSSPGTILGNITKLENSTNRNDQYDVTYWASPVENANLASTFAGVDPNRIFYYDQSQTSITDPDDPAYYDAWLVASGPMQQAKGYAADGPTGTTGVHGISYTGKPNNDNITIELIGHFFGDSDPDNDFNLIGNPYPSAIDITRFFNSNSNIEKTIHLWSHFTPFPGDDYVASDYVTYNLGVGGISPGGAPAPNENIGSSQGFMIRALSAGPVIFTNAMRIADANDQFYKLNNGKKEEIEKDRIWLDINTDQDGINQLLIGFVDKATESVDNGYDSKGIWGVNTIDFFSDIDGENYVIQGLPPFTGEETVDLGFTTRVAPRMLTISITKIEGKLKDVDVLLVDNLLGATHDLKQSDYAFEQKEEGEFKKRFTVQFKGQALDVDDEIFTKNEFIISNDLESLKIRSAKEVKDIRVYDLLGRLIIQQKPNKKSFNIATSTIKNGTVLVIKATLDNGTVISKKTIKY